MFLILSQSSIAIFDTGTLLGHTNRDWSVNQLTFVENLLQWIICMLFRIEWLSVVFRMLTLLC